MSQRFSERIGKRIPKTAIQLDTMDSELRNSLWNVLEVHIFMALRSEVGDYVQSSRFKTLFIAIWFHFLKEPIDHMPIGKYPFIEEFKRRFFLWEYLDVYDFFDFLIPRLDKLVNGGEALISKESFVGFVNIILKRELSGFRVINGQLAPIIHEKEFIEIEKAMDNTRMKNYTGVNIHLTEALNKLSDRGSPDYRNSIKESVSAIESICQTISNNPKSGLGVTLKILKSKLSIHNALEQGFLKLYGYASDSDGIRHALMDEPNIDQEDALFMLVASSAFINYLIAKADKYFKAIE